MSAASLSELPQAFEIRTQNDVDFNSFGVTNVGSVAPSIGLLVSLLMPSYH